MISPFPFSITVEAFFTTFVIVPLGGTGILPPFPSLRSCWERNGCPPYFKSSAQERKNFGSSMIIPTPVCERPKVTRDNPHSSAVNSRAAPSHICLIIVYIAQKLWSTHKPKKSRLPLSLLRNPGGGDILTSPGFHPLPGRPLGFSTPASIHSRVHDSSSTPHSTVF